MGEGGERRVVTRPEGQEVRGERSRKSGGLVYQESGGNSSPPCNQMQSGWLVVVDGCRTVVFRRYVASRVCRSSHSLHWFKFVYHLSSTFSVVSMIVLLVLSMLSLPCGVDDLPSGLVDVVFGLS